MIPSRATRGILFLTLIIANAARADDPKSGITHAFLATGGATYIRDGEGAIQRPDHGNRTHAPKNGEEAQSVPINARQSGRPECAGRQCTRTGQTRRQPGASLKRFHPVRAGPAIRRW